LTSKLTLTGNREIPSTGRRENGIKYLRTLGYNVTHQRHAQHNDNSKTSFDTADHLPMLLQILVKFLQALQTKYRNSIPMRVISTFGTKLCPKSASNLTATITVLLKPPGKRILKSPLYRNLQPLARKERLQYE
jgi:hypothetical protein